MREREVVIPSDVEIAGVLCLPENASAGHRVPAMLLLGGSGADIRDGDLVLAPSPPAGEGHPGTLRRVAHHLAHHGIASLRWDKRGFGASGGDSANVDYDTDLVDAVACFRFVQGRAEVEPTRIAVAGHSAGALVACLVCRDVPDVAAAGLLGALSSSIEDMLHANFGRLRHHWDQFTPEQRDWLVREAPATLVRAEGLQRLLDAARRGDETVRLEGHGVTVELRTARLRQDLATSYAAEFRHVTCPALILHGGDDLNVPVEDSLRSYRELRQAGNDAVRLVVLPGLDHYFIPVSPDPALRVWERVSQQAMRRPMASEALDAISSWAVRMLGQG